MTPAHNSKIFIIFFVSTFAMIRKHLIDIFHPLILEFSTYRGLESARPEDLPVAHKMADSVICLPMHHALSGDDLNRVLELIVK